MSFGSSTLPILSNKRTTNTVSQKLTKPHRIENYSILIATCAPVIRLFLRTFVDMRREGRYGGYPWSRSHSSNNDNNNNNNSVSGRGNNRWGKKYKLPNMPKNIRSPTDDLFDSVIENEGGESEKLVFDNHHNHNHNYHQQHNIGQEESADGNSIPLMPRLSNNNNNNNNKPSSSRTLASGGVTVKTDIVVKVDEESRISPIETPLSPIGRGDGERIEQRASAFA